MLVQVFVCVQVPLYLNLQNFENEDCKSVFLLLCSFTPPPLSLLLSLSLCVCVYVFGLSHCFAIRNDILTSLQSKLVNPLNSCSSNGIFTTENNIWPPHLVPQFIVLHVRMYALVCSGGMLVFVFVAYPVYVLYSSQGLSGE